jgi:hypothetical protein
MNRPATPACAGLPMRPFVRTVMDGALRRAARPFHFCSSFRGGYERGHKPELGIRRSLANPLADLQPTLCCKAVRVNRKRTECMKDHVGR